MKKNMTLLIFDIPIFTELRIFCSLDYVRTTSKNKILCIVVGFYFSDCLQISLLILSEFKRIN